MFLRKYIFYILVFSSFITQTFGQVKDTLQVGNVVVQMNYCISSLTNIIHNKSMSVLEHESYQLINNLTIEQIKGLGKIQEFRNDLIEAIGKFEITEEERALMRRIQSIKRDNTKWDAISNALTPTMLLIGEKKVSLQLAFQALLTAARSGVEYKAIQGGQSIEELQAMWELRKEDMKTISELRKSAQDIIFNLYNEYDLKESDRLTEETSNLFAECISETSAAKRRRVLEDHADWFKSMPDYYYHLGMAYLDSNNFAEAKKHFLHYLELYKLTPILRQDEKSGCIALAMLAHDKSLSDSEKAMYIEIAVKNMPNNSAAILQCVMVYISELHSNAKGLNLLRSAIENNHATDRNLLLMAAVNLLPLIREEHSIDSAISETFCNPNTVSYDSYLTYLVLSEKNAWASIIDLNRFSDCSGRNWTTAYISKEFNRKFTLTLPKRIVFNYNDFTVYDEEHNKDGITIRQLQPRHKYAFTDQDIEKVKCLKSNKNLKYLYFDVLSKGSYLLKENLDVERIKNEKWPRQSEFTLSEDDIDDIVDFCENHIFDNSHTEITFNDIETNNSPKISGNDFGITFIGNNLIYEPHHSIRQEGHYVRIVLSNGLQIVYRYDNKKSTLIPYFYYDGNSYTFMNPEDEKEYNCQDKAPKEEEPSMLKRTWSTIKGWVSSDDKK